MSPVRPCSRMSCRGLALATLLVCAAALPAAAQDRTKICLWNVGGQAGMTAASAALQHKIHGWRDLVRVIASGSVSGLGIYEAKSLVGRDHPRSGWLLANVAGSVSENAAAGRHPLAQVGYTVGPVRLRFSMPRLDRERAAWVSAYASVFEAVALADAISRGGTPRWRDGLIAFNRPLRPDDEHIGVTAGVFPSVYVPDRIVWLHEFTHAVQALQLDVPEPPSPWHRLRFDRASGRHTRVFAFEQIKIGMFSFANTAYLNLRPYDKRWVESEAYQLTAPSDPWR